MTTNSSRLLILALAASLLGAPAHAGPTGPLSVPQEGQAALDGAYERSWGQIRPELEAMLRDEVKKLTGTKQGGHEIERLDVDSVDLNAPPRIVIEPRTTGQKKILFVKVGTAKYDGETVRFELPREGKTWSVTLKGRIDKKEVTVKVTKLKATDEVEIDTSDPARPKVKKTGELKLDYDLSIKTDSFLTNVLLFFVKPFISKALRKPIDKALESIDQQLATAQGKPGAPFGTGAPARGPLANRVNLEQEAVSRSDEIQKTHTPYGTVVSARMSDPTFGQGSPVSWFGYGDSALWTGYYLAGESYRYAVTKDPAAQANAVRTLDVIRDLFDVEKQGGGLLARCRVPDGTADAAEIAKSGSSFKTNLNGTDYVCLENISRDQYTGILHGLSSACEHLDDPASKQLAAELIGRAVTYLHDHGWAALRHDGKKIALPSPLAQGPLKIVAFTAIAARADARFQPLYAEVAPLAHAQWFFVCVNTIDPLGGYFKWNLGYTTLFHAMRNETDPARHMALERAHAMELEAVGHHENPYFQTIDAAIAPSMAARLGPVVEDELQRFAQRSRRSTVVRLSQDPTIEKTTYTAPLSSTTQANGLPKLGNASETVAKYPIPIELRGADDFIWQRSPFQLDGGGDPTEQNPGVDLVLPYWMARFHGVVK